MKLPNGVFYKPRQRKLITKGDDAIINIDEGGKYSGNCKYGINSGGIEKIERYFNNGTIDFYKDDKIPLKGSIDPEVFYSGAEHTGNPKLPNIKVVQNLFITPSEERPEGTALFRTIFGLYHGAGISSTADRTQKVYEFQSYGMLVLDREDGKVELWVAKDGDKVAIPNKCHMTLYNLGDCDNPLITLDYGDPKNNSPNNTFVAKKRPILLGYYNDHKVVFNMNRLYIKNTEHSLGVKMAALMGEMLDQKITIQRAARLDLGTLCYEELTRNPDVIGQFALLGIQIKIASPEAALDSSIGGERLVFYSPLSEATKKGTKVFCFFNRCVDEAPKPGASDRKGIVARQLDLSKKKEKSVELVPVERKLQILIEGAGEWVEKAYRAVLAKQFSDRVAVYYADDTRWKGARPSWLSGLKSWETYLDKADPEEYKMYRTLNPDVVFVVIPDFMHSAVARYWLGKAPLVFVEKPFDSRLENVDALLREMGRKSGTAVLGLDHYQFYALPIPQSLPEIMEHLDGALSEVAFYMAEERPIEIGRERTLQYGLTLDMLPHCFALLSYFGDMETVDDIRVLEAGRYKPLNAKNPSTGETKDISQIFHNETYSRIQFTFQDYSGNGFRIPCLAVVGKGFKKDVKYLELTGRNGNRVRLDLNTMPSQCPETDYPYDSLFYLKKCPKNAQGNKNRDPNEQIQQDPYNEGRKLIIDSKSPQRLERSRYQKLFEDLVEGGKAAVGSTLTISEAEGIVLALDRIWRELQVSKGSWKDQDLSAMIAVRC